MSKITENRAATLAAVIAGSLPGHAPHMVMQAVVLMIRAAKAHKRAAEAECSYEWANEPAYRRRIDGRLAGMRKRAVGMLGAAVVQAAEASAGACGVQLLEDGVEVHTVGTVALRLDFGGDPRGACGWLYVSGRDGDSFAERDGLRGWAIY